MLTSERELQERWIMELADEYGNDRGALLPILHAIQDRYTYIDEHAQQVVADLLEIHPVEVHSVISFYAFLDEIPQGKFVIRLCKTISCELAGKDKVARQLENDLGIKFGETTPDGMFTLAWGNCMGMCDRGPALLVNEKVYTGVTPEKVYEIIEECRGEFGLHAVHKEH